MSYRMSFYHDTIDYDALLKEKLNAFKRTWYCIRCRRYCPNCAGRSCYLCCKQGLDSQYGPSDPYLRKPELRPVPVGITHQDSMFACYVHPQRFNMENSFQAKPYYVVHPEWISEAVTDPCPKPLDRPPWPWEQPRYRVNMQLPTTYDSPAQKKEGEEEEKKEEEYNYAAEVPPLSYQLTQAYRSTHPEYVMRY